MKPMWIAEASRIQGTELFTIDPRTYKDEVIAVPALVKFGAPGSLLVNMMHGFFM